MFAAGYLQNRYSDNLDNGYSSTLSIDSSVVTAGAYKIENFLKDWKCMFVNL